MEVAVVHTPVAERERGRAVGEDHLLVHKQHHEQAVRISATEIHANKKVAGIDTTTWEADADDRDHWRAVVKAGMRRGEENRSVHEAVKREKRKQVFPPCTPSSTNDLHLP